MSPDTSGMPPQPHNFKLGCTRLLLVVAMGAGMVAVPVAVPARTFAQATPAEGAPQTSMRQHYDEAFRLQDAGQLDQADAEHRLFLAAALHQVANGRANLGEYARAVPLYEDALHCAAGDLSLQLDFASAALDAGDWAKAKQMAQGALTQLASAPASQRADATTMLAQALWSSGEHDASLEAFRSAAALQPSFETSYAVARTYLGLSDLPNAAKVFAGILDSFGDKAISHMKFGRAYALANYYPEAIEEFKKAIAQNDRLPGAHYSLGGAYLQQEGEQGYTQAVAEFQRELELNPNDTFTYPQLGAIAVTRHQFVEAEADFKRAIELDPSVSATYYSLGQLYITQGRTVEAEAVLRKAIAVMIDPARNSYEGQRIHYALGRVLLENGNPSLAKQELKIAESLLTQSRSEDESHMGGKVLVLAPLEKTRVANPADLAVEAEYESKVSPLIAGSYDNLGVHSAMRSDYAAAAAYFEKTASWNPALPGVDNNLGRAAFLAKQYKAAVGPLDRALAAHPEDAETRSMLGLSCYWTGDYRKAVDALKPMEASLDSNRDLALAYAESVFRAGDSAEGLTRLELIVKLHPDDALPHRLLGEAYTSKQQFDRSIEQLRIALKLDPADAQAKRSLSSSLVAAGQKQEAALVLAQLVKGGSTDASLYLQLARLLLETGNTRAAITDLQTSARLDPTNLACHQALAEAYRKNRQPREAQREALAAETLGGSNRSSAAVAGTGAPNRGTSTSHEN